MHHFETVPNSNKLQTTTEMWLLMDFKIQIQDCLENIVEKGEIAEQFHLFPECFAKRFFPQRVKKKNDSFQLIFA